MKIISSDEIKNEIVTRLKENKTKKNLLIISQGENRSVLAYKQSIIKRCCEFDIEIIDKKFNLEENHIDIVNYSKKLKNIDGFIILQPLSKNTDLSYLRENMPFYDLDGFTYKSLGKLMNKEFSNIPQTAKSCIRFLEYMNVNLESKNVVIANSNNIIGKPLFMYLNSKKATVTLFNSKTKDQIDKIKKCDIFISAIGKANFYDEKYFRDGQILIDVGTSFVDGKMYGDINYSSLENLNLKIVTCKKGVGSITTLSLIETLFSK